MPITVASSSTADWVVQQDATWRAWNNSWSQTYSTSTTVDVWQQWNESWTVTTSASTLNQDIWVRWTTGTTTGVVPMPRPIQVHSMEDLDALSRRPNRTEEEWAAIRAENERLRAERDRLQAAARAEAHKLLGLVLTREQMASYEARRFFDVVGSAGGVYRIHHGTSGNIRRLIDGREVNRLCVHPHLYVADDNGGGHLPTEDVLAAQALALMHDEIGAVSVANVHEGQRHLRAVA